MVDADTQKYVEKALSALRKVRHSAEREAIGSDDAQAAIAQLVDVLNADYAVLNTVFQQAVDAKDYGLAQNLKNVMDSISLTLVGLERNVVALYEADAAKAAADLAPVIKQLDDAKTAAGDAASTAGAIGDALTALTTVIGLAS